MVEIGGGFWWWAAAGSAQLVAGIVSYRRGCGDSFMPFKAFAVASLFVGAGASTVAGILHASGIQKVDDLKQVGESMRKGLGIRRREPPN